MRKVNINIDRPEISSAEIRERKDFESLFNRYKEVEKPPLLKRYRFPIALGALVAVSSGLLLFYTLSTKTSNQPSGENNLQVREDKTMVTNTEVPSTEIQKKEETKVTKEVKKEVKLSPKNNTAIISPEETKQDPIVPDLNMVAMETENRKKQEELTTKIASLENEVKMLKEKIRQLESEKPLKPVKAQGYRFKLDVLPEEFPKIARYKDLLFEADAQDKNFTPDVFKTEWENSKLKEEDAGNYMLTLSKGKKSVSFRVKPVFEGNGYNKAVAEYKRYEKTRDSLAKVEKVKLEELKVLSSNK